MFKVLNLKTDLAARIPNSNDQSWQAVPSDAENATYRSWHPDLSRRWASVQCV